MDIRKKRGYTYIMKHNIFTTCPDCGSKNIQTLLNGRKWNCPDCGFDLYNNVASAVGVFVLNEKGEMLFEKRAKEPRKGFYTVPGGFCEPEESLEESAIRECLEETGIKINEAKYVCSRPNTYLYKNITYKTCDSFFEARLPEGFQIKNQESEVSDSKFFQVKSKEDIDKIPLAFESVKNALYAWVEKRK